MLEELVTLAVRHGASQARGTAISGLTVWKSDTTTGPIMALFEPEFYLLVQGGKRMTIGDHNFEVAAGTCAVASVGMPFSSQVIEASYDRPYCGIELRLDAGTIASLLPDTPDDPGDLTCSISFAQVDPTIVEPLTRLLRLLDVPEEVPVLAKDYERELCFRLLQGPLGPRLRQLCSRNPRLVQIRTAAEWIGRNLDAPFNVEQLAGRVGMSVTSFHRHFKALTAHTPLAYRQQLRLLEARRQLVSGSANVTAAAFGTGYSSISQFSREYKRAFGNAPIQDIAGAISTDRLVSPTRGTMAAG